MSSWVFTSAHDAERALLAQLGQAKVERLVVREFTAGDLADGLRDFAPAVVEVIGTGQAVAVVAQGKAIDGPAWKQVRELWEGPLRDTERALFAKMPLSARAIEKVVAERVAAKRVARVTHYALPPGAAFTKQLQAAGWWRRLAASLAIYFAVLGITIFAWTFVGQAALSGRWDLGWFWGWVILLFLLVPVSSVSFLWQGWLALVFGGLMKQRLLAGALEIDTDRMRRYGVGQLLSRVLESEAMDNLTLTGGSASIMSVAELIAAAAVMSVGPGGGVAVTLFGIWLVVVAGMSWRYARLRKEWVRQRNHLTHDLVEKMTGHRTRIAQQPPELWHGDEDGELSAYLTQSARMDRMFAMLTATGPRGWLVIGMSAVAFVFADRGREVAVQQMVILMGGVMLGYSGLRRMVFGLAQFTAAWQAWEMICDLFQAASANRGESPVDAQNVVASSTTVMDARDVHYAYPGRSRNALHGCSMTIREGDRVLLEGASGSGKSTLGAILAGLRPPSTGLLLAGGVDPATTGLHGWRKRVATAPQYHENHILAAPLGFNLLMGRAWPASREDLREAMVVCAELGLRPLIDKMPGGLNEMVGDSGWQLSQGERSRVYLARAILQGAPLVILDESFAALDPETLEQCLQCVLKRAPSLLVIAHP
ncbi:hypothetical protein F183_A00830 [Bryobacterales bacterium F-183]|nr:hypothetical protein F183_A00830 [Bryobacterales bacterium F-183]